MKSPVIKRSIVIAGHKTSVSLEDAFWKGLKDIAGTRDMTLSELVAAIDSERRHGNLSSAIRLFVLDHYRNQTFRGAERAQPVPRTDCFASVRGTDATGRVGSQAKNESPDAAVAAAPASVGSAVVPPPAA